MDPQSAAHLIRLLRAIAIELRIANDLSAENANYANIATDRTDAIDFARDRYRAEMS